MDFPLSRNWFSTLSLFAALLSVSQFRKGGMNPSARRTHKNHFKLKSEFIAAVDGASNCAQQCVHQCTLFYTVYNCMRLAG